jgi:hypothetical protein
MVLMLMLLLLWVIQVWCGVGGPDAFRGKCVYNPSAPGSRNSAAMENNELPTLVFVFKFFHTIEKMILLMGMSQCAASRGEYRGFQRPPKR